MSKEETRVIPLIKPIIRGKDDKQKSYSELTMRKPMGGDLRGTRLALLLAMDVDSVFDVVPRITDPMITANDLAIMDPVDIVNISAELSGFLTGTSAESSPPL